ncbi:hypothetical protein [Mucilaginibacter polytrichastri]|uniref:HD/PDEase domain-containing protein n=1 Tax=Mucilaginibacter polytrichastri TaxID=1302689 RepID=A0A1Q5ZXM8_9SPHI|nr:hypothetical protein [Mucilaginibacter polytrichastri]OKS86488.1 hypothetical protein RG47T_1944 [Mucilaginibacter polytrichastri]SFS78873.1 hypothetical protein SAMN04487890_10463 [Mucilaginibacter polytrichastri]
MSTAEQLTQWIKLQHEGQLIKRTNQPYFAHLLAVAEMAGKATALGYEIGLCHDLFEETNNTVDTLLGALKSFGYNDENANHITGAVIALTDVFTAAAYPDLSKKDRKKREAKRLVTISPDAQTVKYCDLIYNIGWVLEYDEKHAKKYLKKKRKLLKAMLGGDQRLREDALKIIDKALDKL